MKKKYFGVLLVMVLTIIFAPSVVLAENTSVNVYTNGFDINNNQKIATIDVEENVTTISNIKQTLATTYNFNVSNYIIVNYMNRTVNDNDVVCGSSLTCYNGSNGKYVNIYLKLIQVHFQVTLYGFMGSLNSL